MSSPDKHSSVLRHLYVGPDEIHVNSEVREDEPLEILSSSTDGKFEESRVVSLVDEIGFVLERVRAG